MFEKRSIKYFNIPVIAVTISRFLKNFLTALSKLWWLVNYGIHFFVKMFTILIFLRLPTFGHFWLWLANAVTPCDMQKIFIAPEMHMQHSKICATCIAWQTFSIYHDAWILLPPKITPVDCNCSTWFSRSYVSQIFPKYNFILTFSSW